MPTYQYACTECGHAFEQFQSFSDDTLTTCPECQGRLRKLFGAVGVVFKGAGFYRTDSRDSQAPAEASSSPAASAAGSSTTSESAPSPAAGSTSDSSSPAASPSTSSTKASQPAGA